MRRARATPRLPTSAPGESLRTFSMQRTTSQSRLTHAFLPCFYRARRAFHSFASLTHSTRPLSASGQAIAAARRERRWWWGALERRLHSAAEAAAGVRGGTVANEPVVVAVGVTALLVERHDAHEASAKNSAGSNRALACDRKGAVVMLNRAAVHENGTCEQNASPLSVAPLRFLVS